jgi:acyl-CoA synthetase (AMP-forming)/AMP-acid ligase II
MNLAVLLSQVSRPFRDHPAVSIGTELRHTYGSLQQRVAQLAAGLRGWLGLNSGDRVGLAMKNCPEYLELLWACWHAGLCTVPINARLHPKEFAYILDNAGARLCFTTLDLVETIAPLANEVPGLDRVICVADAEYETACSAEAMDIAPVVDSDPAWLFYTSGTTGRPKGATLTHAGLAAMVWRYYADIDALSPRDAMIHGGPLSHASGLYSVPHVAKGSQQVIPESRVFEPAEIFDLTQHYSDITFFAAPTMLTRLVNHPGVRAARIESIKTIFYGGAPMYLEDLKRALACFGPRFLGAYGQGETPNTITYLSKAMHEAKKHPQYEARLTTVGIPRTGVEVKVADEEDRELAPGQIGEVLVRSDVTMAGYWNNSEASAKTLRGGWLHTGDLGCFDTDGFLTLKDRSKDVIISGGSNIYPREVEEALLKHAGVLEVSVVGRPSVEWGEEVVAFVVAHEGAGVDAAQLDALCLENIARFKRPKDYVFLAALPKNNYGKVLKTELRERLAAARR